MTIEALAFRAADHIVRNAKNWRTADQRLTELRRLTITFAWLTPTNHQHKNYRRAQLWIDVPEENIGRATRWSRRSACLSKNGRAQNIHKVQRPYRAFIDGTKLRMVVSCKEDAGTLDVPVPYAISVNS